MAGSANTFKSMKPNFKEVYSDEKPPTKDVKYKKYSFKKLKDRLKKKKR